ncbi:MAG: YegP family protein [Flavobacteriaceae bacterium]|jgi:hypothetical protein|nr:YegP family protein [Flavobacteriaceae bacterium]MCB0484937.1 YegP family protein [Flavobacteriaceae bacterium]
MAKFEIYTDKGGEFRFRLKAGNGQIILSSEGYTTRAACDNGVASVRKNSADDKRFEILESKGKPYFNLKASNGQVIGTSQRYSSEASMKKGIESVKSNAPKAEVVEV